MSLSSSDQIKFLKDRVLHWSAGGFVFWESADSHALYVALLKKTDGRFYIPKGHILVNESPARAAIREVKEELMLEKDPQIIAPVGVETYSFILPGDPRVHHKSVNLYVFQLREKENLRPLESEGFIEATWFEFSEALKRVPGDGLLKARQLFYFHKPVRKFAALEDVRSISVGIPTYNGAGTIYETLTSIMESLEALPEYMVIKIIICTDHCSDGTQQIVKKFISDKRQNGIEVVLLDNDGEKGKSTTLNKIYQNSVSDLFCMVDDDVILEKCCLLNLIRTLVTQDKIRCVFASWKRKHLGTKNLWQKFWHWILGIKFDIQPYDKPQKIMRGACLMLRRDNFIFLPDKIFNEDQFLQYIYWPATQEVKNAVIYFNSVRSISDYYRRCMRITIGIKQLEREFSRDRIVQCDKALRRNLNYTHIAKLPFKQKFPFVVYRLLRFIINLLIKIQLHMNKNYEWFRIKQN